MGRTRKILDEPQRVRNKVHSLTPEMLPQRFNIKRRWIRFVILCLSCVLVGSCKAPPTQAEEESRESGLGRAEEEATPVVHDVEHPPPQKNLGIEKMQQKAPSTPTPTPNRAIDRPLDPVGKPLTSPTP